MSSEGLLFSYFKLVSLFSTYKAGMLRVSLHVLIPQLIDESGDDATLVLPAALGFQTGLILWKVRRFRS